MFSCRLQPADFRPSCGDFCGGRLAVVLGLVAEVAEVFAMGALGRDIDRVCMRQSSRSKEDRHLHMRLAQAIGLTSATTRRVLW